MSPNDKRSLEDTREDNLTKKLKSDSVTKEHRDGLSTEQNLLLDKNNENKVEYIPSVINQLQPLLSSFRFSGKVMTKSPIYKQFYNKGNVFDFELMDQTGKIKGKVFNEDCELLYSKLTIGNTYNIDNVYIGVTSPNVHPKRYELILDSETQIEQIENDYLSALQNKYDIVSYAGISNTSPGTFIDYVGKVISIGEIENIIKKDGVHLSFRNVEVIDKDDNKINIVFWNKIATEGNSSLGIGKTILFHNVKINDYRGEKKLFYNANSKMIVDLLPSELERLLSSAL